MNELGSLLQDLDGGPAMIAAAPVIGPQTDNQLAQVRLGIAASLYTALRSKHPETAAHALRVAMSGSAWSIAMGLTDQQRDVVEVAALLHDVGIISVPDRILFKAGPLDDDESRIVEASRRIGVEILRSACADTVILEIVENTGAWYDGLRRGYRFAGEQIPLGARMLSILEAFDAMTNARVYREAMSQERALRELFQASGSQFDPELVKRFSELQSLDQSQLRLAVAQRWLHRLDPEAVNATWEWNPAPSAPRADDPAALFQCRLLDNMHDAVVFVDSALRIALWNHGTERLTGIAGPSMQQRHWSPAILSMRNEKGQPMNEDDCPVQSTIRSGVQSLRRLTVCGRNGRPLSVDTHCIPVVADDGAALGAVLLLHDASSETSLEERCQSLHEKATKDPLTQVANRAEFDKVHEAFINHHRESHVPCSLMICDIDLFKKVNDVYGHQAGDDAIKALATLLKNSCRPGDLVARYGGEEFVMLFADCDNAAAARRAEQIRKTLSQICHPRMDGRSITASFGVTEVQPGDTAETMLRRSDRALLMAKGKGRNVVVQLGSGPCDEPAGDSAPRSDAPKGNLAVALEQNMTTPVPMKVAVEKLRGFVADHRASIEQVDGSRVRIAIAHGGDRVRRSSDRPVTFVLDLQFQEEHFSKNESREGSGYARTKIHAVIAPQKSRDRRRADLHDRAREVLASFRSYLIAVADAAPSPARASEQPKPSFLSRLFGG